MNVKKKYKLKSYQSGGYTTDWFENLRNQWKGVLNNPYSEGSQSYFNNLIADNKRAVDQHNNPIPPYVQVTPNGTAANSTTSPTTINNEQADAALDYQDQVRGEGAYAPVIDTPAAPLLPDVNVKEQFMKTGAGIGMMMDAQKQYDATYQPPPLANNYKNQGRKRYQFGGGATTQDSAAIYYNSRLKDNFYDSRPDYLSYIGAKDPKEYMKTLFNNMDSKSPEDIDRLNKVSAAIAETEYNQNNDAYGRKANIPVGSKEARLKKINNDMYQLGDILNKDADTYYNNQAPPVLVHRNIEPQAIRNYISEKASDLSEVPYYDPAIIAPDYIAKTELSPEELKRRTLGSSSSKSLDNIKNSIGNKIEVVKSNADKNKYYEIDRKSGKKKEISDSKYNDLRDFYAGNQYQYGGNIPTSLNGLHEYPNQMVNVPANNITMQGIDKPVLAIPDNDKSIVMQPNQNYIFKNSGHVLEVPLAQFGGTTTFKNTELDRSMYKDANRRDVLDISQKLVDVSAKARAIDTRRTKNKNFINTEFNRLGFRIEDNNIISNTNNNIYGSMKNKDDINRIMGEGKEGRFMTFEEIQGYDKPNSSTNTSSTGAVDNSIPTLPKPLASTPKTSSVTKLKNSNTWDPASWDTKPGEASSRVDYKSNTNSNSIAIDNYNKSNSNSTYNPVVSDNYNNNYKPSDSSKEKSKFSDRFPMHAPKSNEEGYFEKVGRESMELYKEGKIDSPLNINVPSPGYVPNMGKYSPQTLNNTADKIVAGTLGTLMLEVGTAKLLSKAAVNTLISLPKVGNVYKLEGGNIVTPYKQVVNKSGKVLGKATDDLIKTIQSKYKDFFKKREPEGVKGYETIFKSGKTAKEREMDRLFETARDRQIGKFRYGGYVKSEEQLIKDYFIKQFGE